MKVEEVRQRLKPEIRVRSLNGWERALAHSVFHDTIPYDRVFLTDWQRMGDAVPICSIMPGNPTAYHISASEIGKPWRAFNVEQQGAIVQSWFMAERVRFARVAPGRRRVTHYGPGVFGGDRSEHDPRFPYIRDVIRARNRRADYVPLTPVNGSDPQVRAMQDKLVALGYLQARHADGTVGRSRSASLDALAEFQKRNGLKADCDFGGPNSLTRRRLGQPAETLVRWR